VYAISGSTAGMGDRPFQVERSTWRSRACGCLAWSQAPLRAWIDLARRVAHDDVGQLLGQSNALPPDAMVLRNRRALQEFVRSVEAEACLLTGRCLSYGEGITYWPVREIVAQAADLDPLSAGSPHC
jgi:hypothetical protein